MSEVLQVGISWEYDHHLLLSSSKEIAKFFHVENFLNSSSVWSMSVDTVSFHKWYTRTRQTSWQIEEPVETPSPDISEMV